MAARDMIWFYRQWLTIYLAPAGAVPSILKSYASDIYYKSQSQNLGFFGHQDSRVTR